MYDDLLKGSLDWSVMELKFGYLMYFIINTKFCKLYFVGQHPQSCLHCYNVFQWKTSRFHKLVEVQLILLSVPLYHQSQRNKNIGLGWFLVPLLLISIYRTQAGSYHSNDWCLNWHSCKYEVLLSFANSHHLCRKRCLQ